MTIEVPALRELLDLVRDLHSKFDALTEPDEVLKVNEAAKLLRIGPNEIRSLAVSGRLPAVRLGNGYKFSRRQLLEWLRAEAAKSTARREETEVLP